MSHVQSILNHLNTSTGKGKGLAGKPGIGKKIKLSPEASPLASHDHQSGSHDHKQSSRDATTHPHILLERCTNNDTVLHMCCSASTGGDVSVDDQPHFAGVDGTYVFVVCTTCTGCMYHLYSCVAHVWHKKCVGLLMS